MPISETDQDVDVPGRPRVRHNPTTYVTKIEYQYLIRQKKLMPYQQKRVLSRLKRPKNTVFMRYKTSQNASCREVHSTVPRRTRKRALLPVAVLLSTCFVPFLFPPHAGFQSKQRQMQLICHNNQPSSTGINVLPNRQLKLRKESAIETLSISSHHAQ